MTADPEPLPKSFNALENAEHACKRCTLYRNATQAVPGQGPRHAQIMLVGEQPGNDEDLAGAPFVGPAGRVLDAALEAAGLAREQIFVTNAVKHFKFLPRGKRRLHQRPNGEEIAACRVWNRIERDLVKPKLTVALGATAVRSLMQRVTTISSIRGKVVDLPDGGKMLATIHPSWLLRIQDAGDKASERRRFIADLRKAREAAE
jgi:uracil-DNA glycosylase family protein